MTTAIRVLVVEDNPGDARLIGENLRDVPAANFALEYVDCLAAAVARVQSGPLDVVLLDLGLPDSVGLSTLITLHLANPAVPIVVLTGLGDEATALKAVHAGAQDYLVKGRFDGEGLARIIRYAIEREGSRRELQSSEARLRAILDSSSDAIINIDESARITGWNLQAEHTFGWPEEKAVGQVLAEVIIPPTARDVFRDRLTAIRANAEGILGRTPSELDALHRDGHRFPAEMTVAKSWVGADWLYTVFCRDIGARKTLEQQYLHSQKMEAVGRLAGGVAHDFNNLLTVILGEAQLAAMTLRPDDPIADPLAEISKAGERAATLTRQLLAFSRSEAQPEPKVFSINELVADLGKMLHRLLGEDVHVDLQLPGNIGPIRADPGQLEQVIVNLAVNARDAMPNGGKLRLETSNLTVDQSDAVTYGGIQPGAYVVLSVTDTGTGMSDEVRQHIFEPFYTTKVSGKGTGLGLATCFAIVTQSGGHIHVRSEMGAGTTFSVFVPAGSGVTETLLPLEADDVIVRGEGTILLVEDEDALRGLATRILQMSGYKVLAAADSEAALALLESHAGEIDLLLADVILPKMKGPELAEIVRERRPGIRILFQSGYTHDVVGQRGLLSADQPLIQKPYTPIVLTHRVRDILTQPAPGGR